MQDDKVDIQLQDNANWRTYHTTINNSQRITQEMQSLKQAFPDKRVRAVDKDGRIIDIIG